MNNHLENGSVLPHGLLGVNVNESVTAFNRAYKNTPMRMGIVTTIYPYNDPKNYTKLTTEYDVTVLEQNENVSCTNIVYRNCVSSEGMGSIADFFEKNLRQQTQNNNTGGEVNTSGQNGAIVILLCLDAYTQKAVIIGGLTHPDRQTLLTSSAPQLYGEYNGVAVAINPDGSTSLTFNGATDNNGEVTNPSQGTTVFSIATDGSYEFTNSAVTIQGTKSGVLNIITTSDANVTVGGNTNITTAGNTDITTAGTANIIAQGVTTIDGSTIKLGVGAVESVILGNSFAAIFDAHVHIGNLGVPTSPPLETAEPSLSQHVFTE